MIILSINGVETEFASDKEVNNYISNRVKEHLMHPYFYLLEDIRLANVKIDSLLNAEKFSAAERAIKKLQNLEYYRHQHLLRKEIKKPQPLIISITHKN